MRWKNTSNRGGARNRRPSPAASYCRGPSFIKLSSLQTVFDSAFSDRSRVASFPRLAKEWSRTAQPLAEGIHYRYDGGAKAEPYRTLVACGRQSRLRIV